MIAIVLAGGYAKRLWPLTLNKPKPLLPVAGKPIINYVLEKLIPLSPPINQIIVSTNLRFQSQFQVWLRATGYHGVEIIPDISQREEEKLGAVRALGNIVKKTDEDILVIAGDSIFTDDLKDFLHLFNKKHVSTIALYYAKNIDEVRSGSTVTLNSDGRIVEFIEKPAQPKTTLVGACIYAFQGKIRDKLKKYLELELPNDEPGRFIEWLCKQEPVYGYLLKNYLWDIGTMESYKVADEFFSAKISHNKTSIAK